LNSRIAGLNSFARIRSRPATNSVITSSCPASDCPALEAWLCAARRSLRFIEDDLRFAGENLRKGRHTGDFQV
jgi:hypothetical protein